MSVLCFGSCASLLKEAMPFSKEAIVDMLIGAIDPSANIDPSDKNKLINSKLEVPQYIKDRVGTPAVDNSIEQYFVDNVVPHIKTVKKNELISRLVGVISGDINIVQADKDSLLSKASATQLASFLSSVYHFAVPRANKLKTSPLPDPISADIVITLAGGRLFLNGKEVVLPDKLTPPENFESDEAVYITELLRAYAETEGVPSIAASDIPQKYLRNFNEQRQNYFNAEAISRRVREVFSTEQDEFEILKQETYDGVIDVHSQNYSNGYERLLKVLTQAVLIPQGKSLLEKQLKWVGNSEKKGVCHILVNDRKITWVVTNE